MTEKAGKRIIKEILIFVICGVLAVLIETLGFNRNAIAGKKVEFCISENSEIPEEIENVKETFQKLTEFQESEDAKEDLEKIPLL